MANRKSVIKNLILIDAILFFVLGNFLRIYHEIFDIKPTSYFKILIEVNLINVNRHAVITENHEDVIKVINLIINNIINDTKRNNNIIILNNVLTNLIHKKVSTSMNFHLTMNGKDEVQVFVITANTTSFTLRNQAVFYNEVNNKDSQ